MFAGIATDIENRCESTVLNHTYVPSDQFQVAEAHSEIISFLSCWFKSSVVGGCCVFCLSLLLFLFSQLLWD